MPRPTLALPTHAMPMFNFVASLKCMKSFSDTSSQKCAKTRNADVDIISN